MKFVHKSILMASLVVASSLLLASCASQPQEQKQAETPAETTVTQELSLTLEELKQYDGQNGNPAYVAVDGIIYDVSKVRKWKDGKHEMGVTAGQDLSELIGQSPHGKAILSEATVVGKIK